MNEKDPDLSGEKMDAFLREMSELALKYGYILGGCGCCHSPYFSEMEGKKASGKYEYEHHGLGGELHWNYP